MDTTPPGAALIDAAQSDLIRYRDILSDMSLSLADEAADIIAEADLWCALALYAVEQDGTDIPRWRTASSLSTSTMSGWISAIVGILVESDTPMPHMDYDMVSRLDAVRTSATGDARKVMDVLFTGGKSTWRRVDATLLMLRLISVIKTLSWCNSAAESEAIDSIVAIVGSAPSGS